MREAIIVSVVTFILTFLLNSCTQATRWSTLVTKVGVVCVGVVVLRCLKEELAWAIDKWVQVISNKMTVIALRNQRIKPF